MLITDDWNNPSAPDEFLQNVRNKWPSDYSVNAHRKYTNRTKLCMQYNAWLLSYLPELRYGGKHILDMSTGPGTFLELARNYGNSIMGTDAIDTVYAPLLHSQDIPFIEVDGGVVPYPFKDREFDVVTLMNAIHFLPINMWGSIMNELFRIAKQTVFIIACSGEDYNEHNNSLFTIGGTQWTAKVFRSWYIRYDRR